MTYTVHVCDDCREDCRTCPVRQGEIAEQQQRAELDAFYRRKRQLVHGATCPCEHCIAYRAMGRDVWLVLACAVLAGLIVLGVVWGVTL